MSDGRTIQIDARLGEKYTATVVDEGFCRMTVECPALAGLCREWIVNVLDPEVKDMWVSWSVVTSKDEKLFLIL